MRSKEEILAMIEEINYILDSLQLQIMNLNLRNSSPSTDKKELFLNEGLPLLMAVNFLADRKAMLYWALGDAEEVSFKLNGLSKKTFEAIRENLELFAKQI